MAGGPEWIAEAYRLACRIELRAMKPGNVHIHAAGHGMSTADFEASCEASAPEIALSGATVGQRILRAVRATREAVGCNTNLGIVLLAAPLAQAAVQDAGRSLRDRLRDVLRSLTVDDAADAYEAIRLAAPGGLGESPRHDVRDAPAVTLGEAMAEAAGRDTIARQYATAYEDIFEHGLPVAIRALDRWSSPDWAAAAVYLDYLSCLPDSHVERKFGARAAEALRERAEPYRAALLESDSPERLAGRLLSFDAALKEDGLNPGTSADLCVATLFALMLDQGCRNRITVLL